ncbi:hypothetical protein SDC9_69546 [bioreactor metagenome]|uniref:Uncharacterized protein n=1 Tax=bioreactor metagenome TaxID=1076179 RepID=A0A644Y931_9ZZZZ
MPVDAVGLADDHQRAALLEVRVDHLVVVGAPVETVDGDPAGVTDVQVGVQRLLERVRGGAVAVRLDPQVDVQHLADRVADVGGPVPVEVVRPGRVDLVPVEVEPQPDAVRDRGRLDQLPRGEPQEAVRRVVAAVDAGAEPGEAQRDAAADRRALLEPRHLAQPDHRVLAGRLPAGEMAALQVRLRDARPDLDPHHRQAAPALGERDTCGKLSVLHGATLSVRTVGVPWYRRAPSRGPPPVRDRGTTARPGRTGRDRRP